MDFITNTSLSELRGDWSAPCLSLYQPTHRQHPENQQGPIRFRNLLKQLAPTLAEKYPAAERTAFLQPLEALGRDHEFWNHTLEGLAVFGAPGLFRVFGLPRPVQELVVVADSFHTKPLRRFLQSTDRYQILGLNLHEIKFYEGNRNVLAELDLQTGVPRTITEALGEELTEPHQTVASHGGTGGESTSMRHGHGGRKDEADTDEDRFFRAIDRAILEHHSHPSGLPLMLAALPEHHAAFRKLSHNPFLMDEGLKVFPGNLSLSELRDRAWQVFEPQYQARLAKLADDFAVAKSQNLGLDDLTQVAEAAVAGKVGTLLIEADRQIPGRLHPGSGNLHFAAPGSPPEDDLLDELGELVLKLGGQVVVMPASLMPTEAGAAATCRY
jgi:hypothetical protein